MTNSYNIKTEERIQTINTKWLQQVLVEKSLSNYRLVLNNNVDISVCFDRDFKSDSQVDGRKYGLIGILRSRAA